MCAHPWLQSSHEMTQISIYKISVFQIQIQFIFNGNSTYMIGVIRIDVHDITNTTQL